MTFEIRNFRPQEYQIVRNWMVQYKWNPGIYDYLAFQEIDKSGFWIGTLDGQPIASLAACQYNENFANVSWYVVKEGFRNKGYGLQVWRKALSRITAKNIALNGVVQQQRNYMKSGFKTLYKQHRFEIYGTNIPHNSQFLIDCKKLDINSLSKYDQQNFPTDRTKFLHKWINVPQSESISYVVNGQILGYGVLHSLFQGYHIGPLFADTYEIALQIFKNLIGRVQKDKRVQIDIPSVHENAWKLINNYEKQQTFMCLRMELRQQIPDYIAKTVYGVTSLSFG